MRREEWENLVLLNMLEVVVDETLIITAGATVVIAAKTEKENNPSLKGTIYDVEKYIQSVCLVKGR